MPIPANFGNSVVFFKMTMLFQSVVSSTIITKYPYKLLFMTIHKYSLKTVYFFSIFVISVIAGVIAFFFEISYALDQFEKQSRESILQQGIEYQGILSDVLRDENHGQIQRLFSSLSAREYFAASWISDENGVLILSAKSSYIGLRQESLLKIFELDPGYNKRQTLFRQGDYLLARFPITLGVSKGYIATNRKGDFWIIYRTADLRNRMVREHIKKTIYLSLIIMTLFLLSFGGLYKSIIVRFLSLASSVKKFGTGDRSLSHHVAGNDEIAMFGKSLNDMFKLIMLNERKLIESEIKTRQYVDTIDKYVITSKTNSKGVIVYVSEAFSTISGYKKEEMIGKNHNLVRHPDTPKEVFTNLWKTIKSGEVWEGEIKNKKKDGSYYWVYARISPGKDENGNIVEYTAVRQDITAQKKMEEIAITDELTRLYNRRYFNEIIVLEYHRALRADYPFAFIIFDVDYFKLYNDTYGHLEGDNVLHGIGAILKQIFQRAGDYCFRLGGEEFGVIAKVQNIDECKTICQNILQRIENSKIEHSKNQVSSYVTVSLGALYMNNPKKKIITNEVYRMADEALYKSKTSGRNRYTITEI